MKKKLLIALLAGTMTVAAPVSCFASEATEAAEVTQDTAEAEAEKEEKTADQKKEELKTVGEKKDGCITFKMKNVTSKKITGLAIKISEETEFPENMMDAEDSFELKEKKKVSFFDLFEVKTREYVVVTFLSILEMAKFGEINIIQENNFNKGLIKRILIFFIQRKITKFKNYSTNKK